MSQRFERSADNSLGDFSHLSQTGDAAMVDISGKAATVRIATVTGSVRVSAACTMQLGDQEISEINRTARLAGIQAAKQTAMLIPLCHQIPLSGVQIVIEFSPSTQRFDLRVTTKTSSATGVEMEAMCAAVMAGTTIYDMIKAVDPAASVGPFQLIEKLGGKSGPWTNNASRQQ